MTLDAVVATSLPKFRVNDFEAEVIQLLSGRKLALRRYRWNLSGQTSVMLPLDALPDLRHAIGRALKKRETKTADFRLSVSEPSPVWVTIDGATGGFVTCRHDELDDWLYVIRRMQAALSIVNPDRSAARDFT